MAHALVSPSAMDCILECPARVRLSQGIHSPDNVWSIAGTVAHAGLELSLRAGVDPRRLVGMRLGEHPEAPRFDAEMAACVSHATKYVTECLAATPGAVLRIEHSVTPGVLGFGDLCWGTPDVQILTPKTVLTLDYKHGTSPVSPKSAQLMTYASAHHDGRVSRFTNVIVQPRASGGGGVREYSYTAAAMSKWVASVRPVAALVVADMDPDSGREPLAPTKPKDPHACHWCPVRPHCPAHSAARGEKARKAFATLKKG